MNGKQYIALGLLVYASLSVTGKDSNALPSLLERNPFFSASAKDETKQDYQVEEIEELEDCLEFVGTYKFGEVRKFSVLLKQRQNEKRWVCLNEEVEGFSLVEYNSDKKMLLVRKTDKVDILPLRERSRLLTNASRNPSSGAVRRPQIRKKPPRFIPSKPVVPESLPSPPSRERRTTNLPRV